MFKRTAILLALILFALQARAEVIDKVVAFIDTEAITLSELRDTYEKTLKLSPDITEQEVLATMINRVLLLREARRLRLEAPDEDQLLEEYIDLKVRAFTNIKESDIRGVYASNIEEFGGKNYADVKDDIEAYLLEKEVNYRIRRHLEGLREKAYVRVLLE